MWQLVMKSLFGNEVFFKRMAIAFIFLIRTASLC